MNTETFCAENIVVNAVNNEVVIRVQRARANIDRARAKAPSGAPSPTDLAAVLSIEPAEVSQVFFAGAGVPFCFAQLSSNDVVDRAAINRPAWAATLARAWSPHVFFFAGNPEDGGRLYARM